MLITIDNLLLSDVRPPAPPFFALKLLLAIESDDKEVSPSMLYATAAVLEGCSFINGGSQNTMCGALLKLAEVKRALKCEQFLNTVNQLSCLLPRSYFQISLQISSNNAFQYAHLRTRTDFGNALYSTVC